MDVSNLNHFELHRTAKKDLCGSRQTKDTKKMKGSCDFMQNQEKSKTEKRPGCDNVKETEMS